MSKVAKRKASRKEFILKKAAHMFRERGFAATSMRDLAEMVGIEAASLYNHIHSKNEILECICFEVANRFASHMDEVESSQQSPLKKIEALLRFHITQMIDQSEEVIVSDREWKHLDEPYLSNFHNQRRFYRKRFADIIDAGINSNEIKKMDPLTAVLTMLHAVSGIESWHHSNSEISGEQLEEEIVRMMIDGLRKP